MNNGPHTPVVVVGAGISGLIAAISIAKADVPVIVLEKSREPGGRAQTIDKNGYLFNLGPHALYRQGHLMQTLKRLGVEVQGAVPSPNGAFALYGGRTHTLPVGLASLMTTGLLTVREKTEFARINAELPRLDVAGIQREPLAAWLSRRIRSERVRQLIEMLVRVTSFTSDPEHQSAGAAIEQLQLGLGGVLYLHGGWQTIVDGLRRVAVESGVSILPESSAVSIQTKTREVVEGVRLSNGSLIPASAVVLAAAPGDVDMLTGITNLAATTPPSVRIATLDVALQSLPKQNRNVAFGVDRPLYFSVHSAAARLAPGSGALVHAARYLRSGERSGKETEAELESVMDLMQPGWRNRVVFRRYSSSLSVTHAQVTATQGGLAGRPPSWLPHFQNIFISGDWVGPRGQLSDAAAASAVDAADLAVAAARRRAA